MLPCLLYEDDHLLVVNKPAGLNTHAPSPYAGEGIYEWLRDREPRWANLAIIHRLDKETSGVMVFSKTPLANHSLTEQFTGREVKKRYIFRTDRKVASRQFSVKNCLVRAGERYVSRPLHHGGDVAETRFSIARHEVIAEPLTGRTHQIRVHAAESGMPILGDTLYGGTPAPRVYLHAEELIFKHPLNGERVSFHAPACFSADARADLRRGLIDETETNASRLIHGASDGWPGWYVQRLGDFILSESEQHISHRQREQVAGLMESEGCKGVYHKLLRRRSEARGSSQASPELVAGDPAPDAFYIRENGLQFELSFKEGYSVGLFLDQRENRRRLLIRHLASGFSLAGTEVLNTFAYTCAFSVCAAKAGARTTSLDLSKKYLAWGQRNFALNQLDPKAHEFLHGDVFDWLKMLGRKRRGFDLILLDPPTFSRSKESGAFRAEKNYGKLVSAALPLLRHKGVLFASANAASWPPMEFLRIIEDVIRTSGRQVARKQYVPQPPDFPVTRAEAAYLKTVWLQID